MTRRSVRLVLYLLIVIGFAAGAAQTITVEQAIGAAVGAGRAFDDHAREAIASVAELRAAQQAYVAAGQGDAFWIGRVASTLESLDRKLASLKGLATAPGTVTALETTAGAIESFVRMDARAREHVRNGQRLLASDLIFTDGLELTATAAGALEKARQNERQALDAALAARRREQAYVLGGAGALALLIALALVPVAGAREAKPAADAQAPGIAAAPPGTSDSSDDLILRLRAPAPTARLKPGTTSGYTPAAGAAPLATAPADLEEAARLCTDLGRVADTRELPGLLQRIAQLLDAPGIVLWVADPAGRELRPALAHGYSTQAVARMGAIPRDAENATAAAFRNAQLRVVKGDPGSNGALAVPLVTSGGCVGVMAAEVKDGRESSESLKSVATILAAQLATLIAVPQPEAVQKPGVASSQS